MLVILSQGVSNFNTYDLATLSAVATQPIEANEARFTVGSMDHEALAYMSAHGIVPIGYSALSGGTDHPAVVAVAGAHKITPEQVVYAYVSQHNISVVRCHTPGRAYGRNHPLL
jgi:diketogulonate reductase-like aldo/keto reductase